MNWLKENWLSVGILFVTLYVAFSIFGGGGSTKNNEQFCRCIEVVGDESNFVCYIPSGEVDTEGECVGSKFYDR